jgi:hypothetical protein
MSIQNALNTAIYTKLSAGTALTTLLGGTLIYYGQAPDGASLPYVVWSYSTSERENITSREMENALVYVRGYAASPAIAGSIDTQISALLHKQTLTVSGWTNFWTARETAVHLPEVDDAQVTTWTSGAYYRIRLDQ